MSFKDNNKVIVISDCLTGKILCNLPMNVMSKNSVQFVLSDVLENNCYLSDNGFMVKVGYIS